MTPMTTALSMADILARGRVLPVVTLSGVDQAVPVARALVDGGITVAEVVLRTPVALQAIEAIRAEVPELLLGAGTVLTPADLAASQRAGAAFAIAPGLTPTLLAAARDSGMPFLPAIASASELMLGMEHGFNAFKLFPASVLGTATLKALQGPFPAARFCATGGINRDNAGQFLALGNVAMVGVSWLTPPEALAAGDWATVKRLAQEAAAL